LNNANNKRRRLSGKTIGKAMGAVIGAFVLASIVLQVINNLFDLGLNDGSASGETDTLGWRGLALLAVITCLLLVLFYTVPRSMSARYEQRLANSFRQFENASADQILSQIDNLDAKTIGRLQRWERLNKNRETLLLELEKRKSRISAVTAANTGSSTTRQSTARSQTQSKKPPQQTQLASSVRVNSQSQTAGPGQFLNAPNPFEDENRKIMKKGKGTLRLICIHCGVMNYVDMALLREVLERRNNTRFGRLSAWSDRQIEGGARLTGRHAAAEASRANQYVIANQVQQGFPCTGCQNPLVH